MTDSKDGHECFKEFFAWGKHMSEKFMLACGSHDEIKPMKVSFAVDLSAAWKLLTRSDAAKIKIP